MCIYFGSIGVFMYKNGAVFLVKVKYAIFYSISLICLICCKVNQSRLVEYFVEYIKSLKCIYMYCVQYATLAAYFCLFDMLNMLLCHDYLFPHVQMFDLLGHIAGAILLWAY